VRYAGVFAFVCAGAQTFAYTKSALTATQPIHCMAVPFGECQSIIASGYSAMLQGPVGGFDITNALASGVPLMMWLAVVVSAHNPQMRMRREGKTKLAPAAYLYTILLVGVVAYTASQLEPHETTKPPSSGVSAATPASDSSGADQPERAGAPATSAR
jgi:hypothetical protein